MMLYDESNDQLQRSMAALLKLQERVRKGAVKLRQLDSERDQLDFSELDDFPRRKLELRHQRRVLNKVTERLTEQLERDADVLSAFRELIDRMGAQLNYATLVQDARLEINAADAEASARADNDRQLVEHDPTARRSGWW